MKEELKEIKLKLKDNEVITSQAEDNTNKVEDVLNDNEENGENKKESFNLQSNYKLN